MRYINGLIAGLTATLLLSILMIAKASFGLLPELNVIRMLAEISASLLGTAFRPTDAWLAHFAIGTVLWGVLFTGTYGLWRGTATQRGIEFSVLAWLAMMIVFMPLAGAGLFGLDLGLGAPVATLVLHVIYGAVLGWSYGQLNLRPARPKAGSRRKRATSRTMAPGVRR